MFKHVTYSLTQHLSRVFIVLYSMFKHIFLYFFTHHCLSPHTLLHLYPPRSLSNTLGSIMAVTVIHQHVAHSGQQ